MTGLGAVELIVPLTFSSSSAQSRIPSSSSTWIQDTYWRPPASGPPMPSLKGVSSLARKPPPGSRTCPVRTIDQAQADRLGLVRGALPLLDDLGVEAIAGGRGLVDDRLAAVPVEADRRLADQHPRLALQAGDRADQVAGPGAAALEDPLLRLVGPALVDLLAEQVDDAVDAVEGRGRGSFEGRLPGVPEDAGVGASRPLRVTRQADHCVASDQQRVAEGRPDEAAGAGDEDLHRVSRRPPWRRCRFPR